MTATCDHCDRAVHMPHHIIMRQLLEYGSRNYCPPCEKTWRGI